MALPTTLTSPADIALFAALRGPGSHIEDAARALADGADPNAIEHPYPALVVATRKGSEAMMRLLLDAGANVDGGTYYDNRTALRYAVTESSERCVRLLLERGATAGARDRTGATPVHAAAAADKPDVIRLLVAHGADADAATDEGDTPLQCAAAELAVGAVEALLELGVAPNGASVWGWTPLHAAIYALSDRDASSRSSAIEVVEMLLARGADQTLAVTDGTFSVHPVGTRAIDLIEQLPRATDRRMLARALNALAR